ncbi:SET domain-containing protein [Rickenella mellea]|uniref:SET domain-containing protein n=1 Tax=Rickenella mellea TaxID=50990 RepID=A0A4Y7QIF6_9AGAM|nr:SET domain-containing protein [Rickenella mellea]
MVDTKPDEADDVVRFRQWFRQNGGFLHPSIYFLRGESGFSVMTTEFLPADTTVVSCPFSLAITQNVARDALDHLLSPEAASNWTERQLICSYLCMHEATGLSSAALRHQPYLDILPSYTSLRTSVYFTEHELELFKGTNLYGATQDRKNELISEYHICVDTVRKTSEEWASRFTCDNYVASATYLSSRAFPSTLMSAQPSLMVTPTSYPVLFPGLDALNHARAQPVTWKVSDDYACTDGAINRSDGASISLMLHSPTNASEELFNNYGPKPNSELILGYGFSLQNNPDDTIVLKIAGMERRWEIGRDARGMEDLWIEFRKSFGSESDTSADPEDIITDDLDAIDTLSTMVADLLDRIPTVMDHSRSEESVVRPDVAQMREHYIEGQTSIIDAILQFMDEKKQSCIERAQRDGVNIVFEG